MSGGREENCLVILHQISHGVQLSVRLLLSTYVKYMTEDNTIIKNSDGVSFSYKNRIFQKSHVTSLFEGGLQLYVNVNKIKNSKISRRL